MVHPGNRGPPAGGGRRWRESVASAVGRGLASVGAEAVIDADWALVAATARWLDRTLSGWWVTRYRRRRRWTAYSHTRAAVDDAHARGSPDWSSRPAQGMRRQARMRAPSSAGADSENQRRRGGRGGDQEDGDPAVAALALARVLDHAGVDAGIGCRRRARRSLNAGNVLLYVLHCWMSRSTATIQPTCTSKWPPRSAARSPTARPNPATACRPPATSPPSWASTATPCSGHYALYATKRCSRCAPGAASASSAPPSRARFATRSPSWSSSPANRDTPARTWARALLWRRCRRRRVVADYPGSDRRPVLTARQAYRIVMLPPVASIAARMPARSWSSLAGGKLLWPPKVGTCSSH